MQLEQSLERLLDMELMILEQPSLDMEPDSDSDLEKKNLSTRDLLFSERILTDFLSFYEKWEMDCRKIHELQQRLYMVSDSDSENEMWKRYRPEIHELQQLRWWMDTDLYRFYEKWEMDRRKIHELQLRSEMCPESASDCGLLRSRSVERLFSFKNKKRSSSEWLSFQQQPINFKEPQAAVVTAY